MNRIAGMVQLETHAQFETHALPAAAWRWLRDSGLSSAPAKVVQPAPGVWIAQGGEAPVGSAEGGVCAWDGQLHNRRALAGEASCAHVADGAYASALCEKDGPCGLAHLIGDWSAAIWDSRRRELVLASDFAGARPLFYAWDGRRLMFSSSLDHLRRALPAEELDEAYIAALLSRGTANDATPYRGIRLVPCGCAVAVIGSKLRMERFWHEPDGETALPDDAAYEERFRELFSAAVRARLETSGTVCAELSGGLDSSSVVSMASRLIESGTVPARALAAFYYDSPDVNDRPFMDAVAAACRVSTIRLEIAQYPPISLHSEETPMPLWWERRLRHVSGRMAALGSSVLLTGQLGDLIMGNWLDDSEQAADYFAMGQWRAGLREALAWSRSLNLPIWSVAGRAALSAAGLGGGSGWDLPLAGPRGEDSLTPRCRKICRTLDSPSASPVWDVRPSQRKRLKILRRMLDSRVLQRPAAFTHGAPSHVYLDRPLVEFMMSIPASVVCRPGEPRRLMRRALSGIVPDAVLRRRSKATYGAAFLSALRPAARLLLKNVDRMHLVQLAFVEAGSLRNRLNRLVEGLECNEPQLRQILLLELWLKRRAHEIPDWPETPSGGLQMTHRKAA